MIPIYIASTVCRSKKCSTYISTLKIYLHCIIITVNLWGSKFNVATSQHP